MSSAISLFIYFLLAKSHIIPFLIAYIIQGSELRATTAGIELIP